MNGISLFQQLIRRQVNTIGAGVANIHGKAAQQLVEEPRRVSGAWSLVGFEQRQAVELRDVLLAWGAGVRTVYTRQALDGVLVVEDEARQVGAQFESWLVHGAVVATASMTVWLQLASPETGALFSVYVDGVLQRHGTNQLAIPVSFDAGLHVIEILANARTFVVALPSDVAVVADQDRLDPPAIDATEARYVNSGTGTASVRVTWRVDERAGGWLVLRRLPEVLGTIVAVSPGDSFGLAHVVVSGDVTPYVAAGTVLYAGHVCAGSVQSVSYSAPLTSIGVRVVDAVATQVEWWVGREATTTDFVEVGRVRRGPVGLLQTFDDVSVVAGERAEYIIRAYSLFNPNVLSPASQVVYLHTSDTTPPGSVTVQDGYPVVLAGRALVRYLPPSDADYRGMRVKYAVMDVGALSELRTIIVDFGSPSVADEVSFVPVGSGDYYFVSFDHAGNEQVFSGAPYWYYTGSGDVYSGGAGGVAAPVIGLQQLTQAVQALLNPPYNDSLNYAVVELSASLPSTETAGVHIHYQLRAETILELDAAETAGGAAVDNPGGTRNRKVAVSRAINDNWIRAWADDGVNTSGVLSYRVDYDNTPEVGWVDWRIDPVMLNGRGLATVTVDDDTQSFEWWLTGSDLQTEDPTAGSPRLVANTTATKSWTLLVNSGDGFALYPGQHKVLVIRPYPLIDAGGTEGPDYTVEFARPPITSLAVENRDATGQGSAVWAKLTFSTEPPIADVADAGGTATGGTATTLQDTGAWTPDQYNTNEDTHAYFYVRLTGGTGAGQCRRITDTATGELTIDPNGPVFNPVPATDTTYQIQRGATLYRTGGTGGWIPVVGSIYRQRLATGEALEYYTELDGTVPENTHRTWLDTDNTPSFSAFTVSQFAGDVTVSVTGDDDAKEWMLYARRGNWPTIGLASGGVVDEVYLRYRLPITKASVLMSLSDGTWYFVGVPYSSGTTAGDRAVAGPVTVDAAVSDPALSNPAVDTADGGGSWYNRVSWNHNTPAVGAGYRAKVYAYREDLGVDTEVELTLGSVLQADTDLLDHAVGERGADVNYTWRYRVALWDADASDYFGQWTTSHMGGYKLQQPSVSLCTFTLGDGDGNCSPFANQVNWVVEDSDDVNYALEIDRYNGSSWELCQADVSTYAIQFNDYQSGKRADVGGMSYSYNYQVRVVRKGDYVTVDTATATQDSKNYATCEQQ